MVTPRSQLAVTGLFGGENTGEDPTLIDPLESAAMRNVSPAEQGGLLQIRRGRTRVALSTMPIASEYSDGSATNLGGRITGIFAHTSEEAGTHLIIASPSGVDHHQVRGGWMRIDTTSPLPAGAEAIVYSQDIVGRGGKAGYTWSVVYGSLPGGLALSGSVTLTETISGTPTTAGTYKFTIKLMDSSVPAYVAYRVYTLLIAPGVPG